MYVTGIKLKEVISIDKLHSVHYFEFTDSYAFPGESHDFWELVYVDKGKIDVIADEDSFVLESGSFCFHHPKQWHTLIGCDGVPSNIVVVTFSCVGTAMDEFKNFSMKATVAEKQLIADIICESREAFISELGDPYKNRLHPKIDSPVGSQQMIKLHLSELLILMLRGKQGIQTNRKNTEGQSDTFAEICTYMQKNISKKLSLKELAKTFGMSISALKILFKKRLGFGVIDYFIRLKIEQAKELLRSRRYNVTQISAALGYDNIYAFSAQFKKFTGMSPTEYLMSIRSLEKK